MDIDLRESESRLGRLVAFLAGWLSCHGPGMAAKPRRPRTLRLPARASAATARSAGMGTGMGMGMGMGMGGHGADADDVRHEPHGVVESDRCRGAGNAGAEQWRHGRATR